ncbi:hypothetical protein BC938DRAFT_479870 [Jimgerdemannia flammicorona]|uniref:Uncharacterized protein n=1 Tax=Jimgerdemannia flammicorona TaxID=994334 RepID=A0A433QK00_9FUNG|nr:hypothetical protein BC938DRAFT_479870 [Jimgerdemannia flammicorona]
MLGRDCLQRGPRCQRLHRPEHGESSKVSWQNPEERAVFIVFATTAQNKHGHSHRLLCNVQSKACAQFGGFEANGGEKGCDVQAKARGSGELGDVSACGVIWGRVIWRRFIWDHQ